MTVARTDKGCFEKVNSNAGIQVGVICKINDAICGQIRFDAPLFRRVVTDLCRTQRD